MTLLEILLEENLSLVEDGNSGQFLALEEFKRSASAGTHE